MGSEDKQPGGGDVKTENGTGNRAPLRMTARFGGNLNSFNEKKCGRNSH